MIGHLSHTRSSDVSLTETKRRYRSRPRGRSAYLIFLATFLYAIAFVGGLVVPRRLDGPLETTLPAALAIDCLLLTIFAVQHSVMARRWFKERWTQIVPGRSSALPMSCAPVSRSSCCSGSDAKVHDPAHAICARRDSGDVRGPAKSSRAAHLR